LIRQWRGQRHEVKGLEHGHLYCGTRYASLSAIACLLSGTHCSVPRFGHKMQVIAAKRVEFVDKACFFHARP